MPSAARKLEEARKQPKIVANRLPEERKGQSPVNSLSRSSRGRVLRVWKIRKRERAMKIRRYFNTLPLLLLLVAATPADAQVQP